MSDLCIHFSLSHPYLAFLCARSAFLHLADTNPVSISDAGFVCLFLLRGHAVHMFVSHRGPNYVAVKAINCNKMSFCNHIVFVFISACITDLLKHSYIK